MSFNSRTAITFKLNILTVLFLATIINVSHLEASENPNELYPDSLIALSTDEHFSQIAFLVDKTERKLKVYEIKDDNIKLLEEHPTDIGRKNGDKEKENDFKTPVGIYFLKTKKTQPEIPFQEYGSMAFTTDYPNIFDKFYFKKGSGIWLHAVPDTIPLTRGSRGCVVVRDDIIKSLEKFIKLGQTPLIISEKINYLTKNDYMKIKESYLSNFEKWRKTWQDSDVDTYIKFYDESFKNSQMNFHQWYQHKKKMKELYSFIKVNLSSPTILRNKNQVVIRSLQDYQSNLHNDYGVKTIHAFYSDEVGFKIIREDWRPLIKEQAKTQSNLNQFQ